MIFVSVVVARDSNATLSTLTIYNPSVTRSDHLDTHSSGVLAPTRDMPRTATHPDTPRPLGSTRQLPASTPYTRPHPLSNSISKPLKTVESFVTPVSRLATPPPFKIPVVPAVVPAKLLTPSTSTVAASSSPRMSASVSRRPLSSIEHNVIVDSHEIIIFGRHRQHGKPSTSASIPSALKHLFHSPGRPTRTVALSRHASHASRLHAAAERLSSGLRVVALGQNGVRLKVGNTVIRLLQGQRRDFSEHEVIVDFYGVAARISTAALPDETLDAHDPVALVPRAFPPSPHSSFPPSSPPLDAGIANLSDTDSRPKEERTVSSPLSDMDVDEEEEVEQIEVRPLPAPTAAILVPETVMPRLGGQDTVKGEDPEDSNLVDAVMPDDVDLPALIASTVVFSGSSKLSLPDLVKHMLEVSCSLTVAARVSVYGAEPQSQPSLKEHGDEDAWTKWVGFEVDGNRMFGKVERHGKVSYTSDLALFMGHAEQEDVSGHPLLPHYFYNPLLDPDISRATELGGLVRPLRATQRVGGRAIDWRPVGSGRRR